MSYLQVKHLYKKYGETLALKNIDFEIKKGEFVVFVGPSGCGKSTLLRTIAGLESSSGGDIQLDGQSIIETHPSKRDVAMVFQSYALYPHMSVKDNMSFALKLAKRPTDEIETKVSKVAKALKLETLLDRKPKALSGGQRQRVAIGRAIVRNPKVFLFDEPLSNLDAALRVEMRIELSRLHQELESTMIYVTHDQVEAMTLADKVVIMSQGEVAQIGSPLALYHQPANRFVATFIGTPKMNVLPVDRVSANDTQLHIQFGADARINLDTSLYRENAESANAIGFRPESLSLCDPHEGDLTGDVEVIEQLGSETLTYIRTLSGETVVVRAEPKYTPTLRTTVGIKLDPHRVYLFDSEDNALNVYGEVSHV
ncbi:ABC transporter ATP-binding protein [Enterovibrio nigricans]|uniref:Multiple sugar transport system ATP-binding protein n=1 Tax=Enterovibrio nigricans DSM 22720 TaxID=1121868 RepID=A0A1T4VEE4_9GAMM|nr:sn-glycerol-3-phosphate ABC transporter ATP-binding protein UgpC [Enterovibrio nigricans]PKF49915.1 sn-glycerol-3-phosphate ABC transporter ATP-binding protein UgpC [Enterovibrio nigricans]SKA63253.1 multiple sugar transport system ATP-binding protein [Enterovibrio nigricans DSM 22720]